MSTPLLPFTKCPKCDLSPIRPNLAVCPRCKFNIAAHAEKLSRASGGGPVVPDAVAPPFDMAAYLASMGTPVPGVAPGQVVQVAPTGPAPAPGQFSQVTPSDVAELVMQVNTAVFHMSGKLDVVIQGLASVTTALTQVVMALHPPAAAAAPALAVVPPPAPTT